MCLGTAGFIPAFAGCRGYQYGHIIKKDAPNLVGSHDAGAEVFDPLVEEAVAKLLGRQETVIAPELPIGQDGLPVKRRSASSGSRIRVLKNLAISKNNSISK